MNQYIQFHLGTHRHSVYQNYLQGMVVVLAMVSSYPVSVQVGTGTEALVRVETTQEPKLAPSHMMLPVPVVEMFSFGWV
jgi:Na+/pantothenate symporter